MMDNSNTRRHGKRGWGWWTGLWLLGAWSCLPLACGQTYTITTLAGSAGASGSADGAAGSARFQYPGAVAASGATNVFVADSANHTIRKVTTAGTVSTLAGTAGASGSADGTGGNARFRSPYGLAVDSAGNILVADTYNHTIRKITPAGEVSTLAGAAGVTGSANGTGPVARFNLPCGVAVDAANNLLVADAYNHTIRKVTPAGVVSTVAGAPGLSGNADGAAGTARFWTPRGVAVDGAGNIFVADLQNQTIRKITPGGTVTTLAGGFTDSLWKWVKHSYAGEDEFREMCLQSLVARGSTSIFYVLENSAEDFNLWLGGNVVLGMYILGTPSPVDGHRTDDWVKRCNSVGVTTQVPVLFNSPDAFAGDFARHAAYIQWVAASIAWAPSDQFIVCISHHTHLNAQISSAWNAAYVNQLAGQVKQATGGRFKVAVHDTYPECIAWGRGSNVDIIYVDRGSRSAAELAAALADVRTQTGKTVEERSTGAADGAAAGVQFAAPAAVATDRAGNVWVVDSGDHIIRRITPGAVVTTFAGSAGQAGSANGLGSAARFNGLSGIAVDRGDNVFVADGNNHLIRKGLFEVRLAVNAPGLAFTTGGDINWIGQTAVSYDRADAARSGPVGDGQQSWMQTTVTGPGSVLFRWKVSSETGGDVLRFAVDGVVQDQLSGGVDWKHWARFLGAGAHTLQWSYLKNGVLAAGADAGWVDLVEWVPCAAATSAPQLLFQHNSGLLSSWVLNSTGGMRFARILGNTEGWKLKTTGDVDRNGTADLIFQTAEGGLALWLMNADGTTRSTLYLGHTGVWEARACADYDGDGHAELFFQTPGGDVAYWHMATNGAYLGSQGLGNMGVWRLKTAANLEGGTAANLLWQHPTGTVVAWFHNPDQSLYGRVLGATGAWDLRGAVDLDGGGIGDLLWQTPDAQTAGWIMNTGGTVQRGSAWGTTTGWRLQAGGR